MAKQEFLQLAHTYDKSMPVAGKFMSEKLDGQRAMWDGGVTRGVRVENVPWANIEKSNHVPVATGLYSRYGKVINAPDWWLSNLPPFPLDMELWTGHGEFQRVSSIVRSNVNVKDWHDVKAVVFDAPFPGRLFADREINNTNFKKRLRGCYEYWQRLGGASPIMDGTQFAERFLYLSRCLQCGDNVQLLHQERLPFVTSEAQDVIGAKLEEVLTWGGEGVMIKSPNDVWKPERCYSLLKYKPWMDAEAEVVGYTFGRETDKGSKYLGLMGALICKINAGQFKVSGFTDEERELVYVDSGKSARDYGEYHPGEEAPMNIINPRFPRGAHVTFKYRELTDSGLPKEGRYHRVFVP